ncbi:HK97 gp10 family phage protein [Brevibacillus borstelensis]|uniref:HK97 gp10 family phage protein n=1 Tax=Brevibacillus borstelensis TaxID=45462 RepID=UPI00287F8281|nr:HK97 gp10 family phage protein [Brevibacillus borstelensis]WNF06383.1 HK97 gp10 family phage protein [Brevibacillus borstelensis]
MALEFSMDISKLIKGIEKVPETMYEAAKRGLHDVMDEWQQEAIDLAPLYKRKGPKDKRPSGTLRSGIHTSVEGNGHDLSGEIHAAAVEIDSRGRRFNYAYYLHEIYPEKHGKKFKNPSTPGTIPEFLDTPLEERKREWVRKIEDEIKQELRKDGW